MKELKCTNCSSNDLQFENGLYVCQNCGSKFIPDKEDKDIDRLEDKMCEAWIDEKYDDAKVLSDRLINVAPLRAYGWAIRGGCLIGNGITDENAEIIVDCFEKTLQYANVDEIDDLTEFVKGHVRLNGSSILRHNNSLKDRLLKLYPYLL
ncbi:MAG: hypothetical protein E7309_09335 [Butyrivibrio sp.]|jgi:hypothetical protein|nr:hypothetical protein [Butyrivibrio sp.]